MQETGEELIDLNDNNKSQNKEIEPNKKRKNKQNNKYLFILLSIIIFSIIALYLYLNQIKLRKQIYIKLLSVGIGWLVTLLTFFLLSTLLDKTVPFQTWLVFIYGIVITGIILLVWDFIYHHRFLRMIDTSIIIWSSAMTIYFTLLIVNVANLPLIFIVAVPLQILEIIWFLFRRNKKRNGTK